MIVPTIEIEDDMPLEYVDCILQYLKSEYPNIRKFRFKKISLDENKLRKVKE